MEAIQAEGPILKEDLGHGKWYKKLDETLAKGALGKRNYREMYTEVKVGLLSERCKVFPR